MALLMRERQAESNHSDFFMIEECSTVALYSSIRDTEQLTSPEQRGSDGMVSLGRRGSIAGGRVPTTQANPRRRGNLPVLLRTILVL